MAKRAETKSGRAAASGGGSRPLADLFGDGVAAMQRGRWREAIEIFARVGQSPDGEAEIVDRARQYLELSRARFAAAKSPEPEPEDAFLAAVVAKNAGELDQALALCRRGGRQRRDERMAYLAASILALSGEAEEALELLEIAIEKNPRNRVLALRDPDFAALRGRNEFVRLLRPSA